MAIHSSIPPVPPKRDADSSTETPPPANAVRSEQVAQGFRGAMSRSGGGAGGQTSGGNSSQSGGDLSSHDMPLDSGADTASLSAPAPRTLIAVPPTPLSPAMLRLQQQGVSISPQSPATAKLQTNSADQNTQQSDDISDSPALADESAGGSIPAKALAQSKPAVGVKTATPSLASAATSPAMRQQTSPTGNLSPAGKELDSANSGEAGGKGASVGDSALPQKSATAGGPALEDVRLGKATGGALGSAKPLNPLAETASLKDAKSTGNADPRNAVAPVGPGIAPQPIQPAAPADQPAPAIPSAVLQQVVDYATVHQNRDGFYEFQLGLNENVMGGMNIQVTALANRRVGLKVRSTRGGASLSDEDVQGLIAALRSRGVDVVDVDIA